MTETPKPSCPQCSLNGGVVVMEAPERRPGRPAEPMLDAASVWPWLCTDCNTVFTGTLAEWERMSYQRHTFLNRSNPRGQR